MDYAGFAAAGSADTGLLLTCRSYLPFLVTAVHRFLHCFLLRRIVFTAFSGFAFVRFISAPAGFCHSAWILLPFSTGSAAYTACLSALPFWFNFACRSTAVLPAACTACLLRTALPACCLDACAAAACRSAACHHCTGLPFCHHPLLPRSFGFSLFPAWRIYPHIPPAVYLPPYLLPVYRTTACGFCRCTTCRCSASA